MNISFILLYLRKDEIINILIHNSYPGSNMLIATNYCFNQIKIYINEISIERLEEQLFVFENKYNMA